VGETRVLPEKPGFFSSSAPQDCQNRRLGFGNRSTDLTPKSEPSRGWIYKLLHYESFSRKIYPLVRPEPEHCPYCLSTDRHLSFMWRFLIWAEYTPAKETIPPQSAGKRLFLSLYHSFQFNKQFDSPVKLKYNVYLSVVNKKRF